MKPSNQDPRLGVEIRTCVLQTVFVYRTVCLPDSMVLIDHSELPDRSNSLRDFSRVILYPSDIA